MAEILCRKGLHSISSLIDRASDGRCIQCKRLKDKRYFLKDIDRVEARKKRSKEWKLANPTKYKQAVRKAYLRKTYNISPEEYELKLKEQLGVCYICKQPEHVKSRSGNIKLLSVDHNHLTNKNRHLLCHNCNAALGHVNESIPLLEKMIIYLQEN